MKISNLRQYIIDINGKPIVGAKLFFYAAGTTVLSDTFSDASLTVPNSNPVLTGPTGLLPEIYLSPGLYKIECQDSNGLVQWTNDNVGGDIGNQFGAWVNETSYGLHSAVYGSDNDFYRSLSANNQGNDPTESPNFWKKVLEFTSFPVNSGMKPPCEMASKVNVTKSGLQTIGGLAGSENSRILLAGQTNAYENGIWLMRAADWVRADDWNETGDVEKGISVNVYDSSNAGLYLCSFAGQFTLDTTDVTLTQLLGNGVAAATAQANLAIAANTSAQTAKTGAETAKVAAELAETNAELAETNAQAHELTTLGYKNYTQGLTTDVQALYLGTHLTHPTTDNAGQPLVDGATYVNNSSYSQSNVIGEKVHVYSTSLGWQATSDKTEGPFRTYRYISVSGQTVFTGSDTNGNTLLIPLDNPGERVQVFYGGVLLDDDEFTISTASQTVTLTTSAATGKTIKVQVYGNHQTNPPTSYGHIPSGIIMALAPGLPVPPTWVLCDGTNGTRDLRGMVILGASAAYADGSTGGTSELSATVTVAGHSLSGGQNGPHAHLYDMDNYARPGYIPGNGFFHNHTIHKTDGDFTTTSGLGTPHAHGATLNSLAGNNLPPYVALRYIQKL